MLEEPRQARPIGARLCEPRREPEVKVPRGDAQRDGECEAEAERRALPLGRDAAEADERSRAEQRGRRIDRVARVQDAWWREAQQVAHDAATARGEQPAGHRRHRIELLARGARACVPSVCH